jgi:hypothetical protein
MGRNQSLFALTDLLRLDDRPPASRLSDEAWSEVLRLANLHLLGPALHRRMRVLPEGYAADGVTDYLAMLATANRKRNRALRRQGLELIETLNREGIEPLILKGGIFLFEPPCPLLGRGGRMMRDIDLLVRPAEQEKALSVLEGLGYRAIARYPEGHHALGDFARQGDAGAIDLHTELVDPAYVIPARSVRWGAIPLHATGLRAWLPNPTDRLLHHIIHAQVHYLGDFHRAEIRLNQLFEFAALARRYGGAVDWPEIESRLGRFQLSDALHSYLITAERLFGLNWPLAAKPTPAVQAHAARCLRHLRYPILNILAIPLGNLRRVFAAHRMTALYGETSGRSKMRHAAGILRKMPIRRLVGQVFRTR